MIIAPADGQGGRPLRRKTRQIVVFFDHFPLVKPAIDVKVHDVIARAQCGIDEMQRRGLKRGSFSMSAPREQRRKPKMPG